MEDGKVEIGTKLNTTEAEKGIKGLKNKLSGLGDNKTLNGISKIGMAVTGLASGFGLVVNAVKSVNASIKDLTETYAKQKRAEVSLETAVRNNPYMSSTSIQRLKDYASELQGISTVGDEELIPMMARLAASGRTQDEIMSIMSASLDISASGAMSLDEAVTSLNKTFSGNIGLLGSQNRELKDLTEEELKQGKAVEILASKYKGMAKDVTDATGGTQQLANAWGDFKEIIGEGFMSVLNPISQKIASMVSQVNNLLSSYKSVSKNASADELDQFTIDKADQEWKKQEQTRQLKQKALNKAIEDYENFKRKEGFETIEELSEINQKFVKETYTDNIDGLKAEIKEIQKEIKKQYDIKTEAELKIAQREAELNRKAKEASKAVSTAGSTTKSAKETYNDTIASLEYEILARKQAGLAMTEEEEAQARLNTMLNAYIQAMQSGEIKAGDKWIDKTTTAIKEQATAYEKTANEAKKLKEQQALVGGLVQKYSDTPSTDEIQKLTTELNILKEQSEVLKDQPELYSKVQTAIDNCNKALEQANYDKLLANIQSIVNTVEQSLSSLSNSVSMVTSAAISESQRDTEKDIDNLKTKLDEGIIDYDEYLAQKTELEKKAARKEYKLQMAQWRMNLAVATAQSAQAVLGALADTTVSSYTIKLLNSVAAGLLGAANVATIAGSKPVAPSFSTGGFLTGSTTSGDKIPFMGNAGEAILNPAEMRNFMDLANGNGAVNVSMPVTINNSASDKVSVSATQNNRQLIVTVQNIVSSGLKSGVFNEDLAMANANAQGAKYL